MWSPERPERLAARLAGRRGFLRLALAGAGAATLAACGFKPALREDGGARSVNGATAMIVPDGRLGFELRTSLENRMGRVSGGPVYTLTADLTMTQTGLVITQDSDTTRYVVRGRSIWSLDGPEGFKPLAGAVEAMSAYSATGSVYATRAARRDAEARVARELGERIWVEIAASLGAGPQAAG